MSAGRFRYGHDREHGTDDEWNGSGVAAGKQSLTARLQRKTGGSPPPAAGSEPRSDVSPYAGLSSDVSYVDSILDGPVQRRADTEATGPDVHALAAHGTSGSGGPLPFLEEIQRAFGSHDVRAVQAHTDGNAAAAATGMGATAFATGNHVAFAGAPDLHTAAHEAAHVVQQRAGVHLAGGVGAEGDAYEQHADAVAARVVAGESAEDLLGDVTPGGATAQVQHKSAPPAQDPSKRLGEIAAQVNKIAAAGNTVAGGKDEDGEIVIVAAKLVPLLDEAAKLLSGGKGGSNARYATVVKSMQPGIDGVYAWARLAKVEQQKVHLDGVFNRWDDALAAVGHDRQKKAATYYGDWKVDPKSLPAGDAKKSLTQHDLVERCLKMYETDQTLGQMLAIEQIETLLNEPAAPPEPGLLESLLSAAVETLLGKVPGILGGHLGKVFSQGFALGEKSAGKLTEHTVAALEAAFGKLKDAAKGDGKPIPAGNLKTTFLNRTRSGAYLAMREVAGALADQREVLERMPPGDIAHVYLELQKAGTATWTDLKQKIIFEWLNFRATLDHGMVKGKPGHLDYKNGLPHEGDTSKLDPMGRADSRVGMYVQTIEVTENGFHPRDWWGGRERFLSGDQPMGPYHAAYDIKPGVASVTAEPAIKRELVDSGAPVTQLAIHRLIEIPGLAKLYITASGERVWEFADVYLLSLIAKGQSIKTPTRNQHRTGRTALENGDYEVPLGNTELVALRAKNPGSAALANQGLDKIFKLGDVGAKQIK